MKCPPKTSGLPFFTQPQHSGGIDALRFLACLVCPTKGVVYFRRCGDNSDPPRFLKNLRWTTRCKVFATSCASGAEWFNFVLQYKGVFENGRLKQSWMNKKGKAYHLHVFLVFLKMRCSSWVHDEGVCSTCLGLLFAGSLKKRITCIFNIRLGLLFPSCMGL